MNKIIFGTTNETKKRDVRNIIKSLNLDIEVLGLDDIEWDRGEIPEDGLTLEENSLIKAEHIYAFCQEKGIDYPIVTDDSGLFVDVLGDEPGVYTARYADDEIAADPSLPKSYSINKLLNKLNEVTNRGAEYRCCVTTMFSDHQYVQTIGTTRGHIATEVTTEIKKPWFYTIFMVDEYNKSFHELTDKERETTYRQVTMKKVLSDLVK